MNIKNEIREYHHPDTLLKAALEAIVMDVQANDLTAIEELLMFIHPNILRGYLPEPRERERIDHWQRLRADYPAIERAAL